MVSKEIDRLISEIMALRGVLGYPEIEKNLLLERIVRNYRGELILDYQSREGCVKCGL